MFINNKSVWYTLLNEMPKTFYSILLTQLVIFIIKSFIRIPAKTKYDLNKSLESQKQDKVLDA